MILKINKKLIFYTLILISTLGFSQQNLQGKVYYYSKTKIDTNRVNNNSNINENQKKRIIQRMKNMFQKKHILTFNKSESIFKIQEKLHSQQNSSNSQYKSAISSSKDGVLYKNTQTKKWLKDSNLFGKNFLISDSLKQFTWKITGETKKIGQYTCFKAITSKTLKGAVFGKKYETTIKLQKDESKIQNKQIEIVAWYTTQIPVSHGPYDYWGLPGLILEINTDKITINCSKIILNPKNNIFIEKPTKGKVVSKKEYTDISRKEFTKVRERFRKKRM